MHDTLLQLPLFRGIAENDFNNILQKVKLDFCRYEDGADFIYAGDKCDSFVFLLSGKIKSVKHSKEGHFTFEEVIEAPYFIEPYSLFGISARYNRGYSSLSNVGILKINKQYIYSEFYKYHICRMNYLNILSSKTQVLEKYIWSRKEMTLRQRMIDFIQGLSEIPYGEKHLQIKMEDLAALTEATRINVSRELNRFNDEKLAELKRKMIIIPALERLTQADGERR